MPEEIECNHEWEFKDDSFGHEFGTEQVYYYECKTCGATRPCDDDPDDFYFEELP